MLGSAITIVDERNKKKSIEIMISLMEVLESIYGLMAVRDPNYHLRYFCDIYIYIYIYTLYEEHHCLKSSKPTSTHVILSLILFFTFFLIAINNEDNYRFRQ